MKLHELITKYRKEHSLSQRQFAQLCDISHGYANMIEKNINPNTGQPPIPSVPMMKKIAAGMGISLNDLFNSIEDMPIDLATSEAEEKLAIQKEDAELREIMQIFISLNSENRAKLLELSRLYLNAQNKK